MPGRKPVIEQDKPRSRWIPASITAVSLAGLSGLLWLSFQAAAPVASPPRERSPAVDTPLPINAGKPAMSPGAPAVESAPALASTAASAAYLDDYAELYAGDPALLEALEDSQSTDEQVRNDALKYLESQGFKPSDFPAAESILP